MMAALANEKMMIVYCIFMAVVLIAGFLFFILESREEIKKTKEYNAYIESIKVGDEFVWQEESDTIKTDPFVEKDDYSENICVIADVRENGAGYKWVKYYYKKYVMPGYEPICFTQEINAFVRHKKRINTEILEN